MTMPSYLKKGNGLCPLYMHVIFYRRESLCLNAGFLLPGKKTQHDIRLTGYTELFRNLYSAYQHDWCCPLEKNGYNSWITGQLLTWVSAEHRGFMSQKPETQCGNEHCTVPHQASPLWNCEGRIPETRNTFSSFSLQDNRFPTTKHFCYSSPRTRNNGIKLSTRNI